MYFPSDFLCSLVLYSTVLFSRFEAYKTRNIPQNKQGETTFYDHNVPIILKNHIFYDVIKGLLTSSKNTYNHLKYVVHRCFSYIGPPLCQVHINIAKITNCLS